jgi:saccharopine dehydrogenase-like NADP-dependent oxidoreductase
LALFDPDRSLDKIVAVLPLGLDPGSYNLMVDNSVKGKHSQKSDKFRISSKSSPENEYVDRFVFAYGS